MRDPFPLRSLPPPRLDWAAWALIAVVLVLVIGLLLSVSAE